MRTIGATEKNTTEAHPMNGLKYCQKDHTEKTIMLIKFESTMSVAVPTRNSHLLNKGDRANLAKN